MKQKIRLACYEGVSVNKIDRIYEYKGQDITERKKNTLENVGKYRQRIPL